MACVLSGTWQRIKEAWGTDTGSHSAQSETYEGTVMGTVRR